MFANYNGCYGDEKVWAAYGELLVPVLKNLEITGAVRYDHYDNFNSTTPKIAAKFTPIQQLAFRASYSEGFRAPNPAEASPTARRPSASAGAHDPIRCPGGVQAPGAVAADCTGSAAGGIGQGNPDLQPEKSKNFNFGFVAEPVKGLTLVPISGRSRRQQYPDDLIQEAFNRPDVVRSDNNLWRQGRHPEFRQHPRCIRPVREHGWKQGCGCRRGFRIPLEDAGCGQLQDRPALDAHNNWKDITVDGVTRDFVGTHGNCDVSNCAGTPRDKVNLSGTWETAFGVTAP